MLDVRASTSLPAMFMDQADRMADQPFLWGKSGGAWRSMSWQAVASSVLALAAGLEALGLEPGDRVALVAENRAEWAIADLAIMAAGAISVPAYTTNTVADHLHILDNSGARLVIVSTRQLAERVLAAASRADRAPTVIAMEPPPLSQSPGVELQSWDAVMAMGRRNGGDDAIRRRIAGLRRADTACLIYTSGTGGVPKGVMQSHGAILHNCRGAMEVLKELGLGDNVFLSFLPLSHAYEHTAGLYFPIAIAAQIYYAESVEQLAANMAEIHPTIMTAVPRLYESMRARILKGLARVGRLRRYLFLAALDLGTRRIERGGRLGPLDSLADLVLERLVRDKVRARFGGRLKAFVSGGAPLSPEVGTFFLALGVRVLQGYGQTESAPVISVNRPGRIRIDTVGPVIDDVEIRIADDGEIQVRGELVMQGYWRDPETTAAAIDADGWLRTGDIGVVDPDGYVRITDRKRDIIVNSGGDNVAPQRIESFLTLQPEIAQAMVHGDRRPHLVALVVPDRDWAEGWARAQGRDPSPASLIHDPDFRREMARVIDRVNAQLSPVEKIRRFLLTAEEFSVENGTLTPTLKIRRHKIRESFAVSLEGLYEDKR